MSEKPFLNPLRFLSFASLGTLSTIAFLAASSLTMPVINELGFHPENVFLSLEMKMKCGIGKCGRCNIGNKFVCKDGPVFAYKELEMMPKEY